MEERASSSSAARGITHLSSRTALRVSSQLMALDRLDPAGLDPRLGPIDAERLADCEAVILNIEYPLGLAAYNILRELTEGSDVLRGVYVLGKAATLNADVGDVLISGVIHDEHSGSTYWLDNAFSFDDIAPFLVFGSGLDNQRAVTVKSTFLQNRNYLDFYYREAYTVVEMEAGPFCNAVYEIADADRYPIGEAVSSPSSRSTSGSSTTPLIRRTRRRGRWAPAGCRTSAWTRPTRPPWRSSAGSSRSRACSTSHRRTRRSAATRRGATPCRPRRRR